MKQVRPVLQDLMDYKEPRVQQDKTDTKEHRLETETHVITFCIKCVCKYVCKYANLYSAHKYLIKGVIPRRSVDDLPVGGPRK